ncbi:MAG: bifunctional oligoribonuclease/PAP phosphatase NrnA [bacterium]|nr:bifunctional oligoribonuclease/PAP phosphatase NrnA [Candidatus Sumerlaeota bacterium]
MTSAVEQAHATIDDPSIARDVADVLLERHSFLIAGHLRPDGDCLGSALALMVILRQLGKSARFYTTGPIPPCFCYLPYFGEIETSPPPEPFDAIICVDSSDFDRVEESFKPTGFVINIDHHLTNAMFGNLNWVDTTVAATGELIYRLAHAMNHQITPDIASCLFTAIMTDTGGFRYSNTTEKTFQVVAHLVRCGAAPGLIAQYVFDSRKPQSAWLAGNVLTTLKYEFDGRFVWNKITHEQYAVVGGDIYEPEGLTSEMRAIDGVEIAVLFHETPDNRCRLGLRSRGLVDVSKLAEKLGGGGHHNASGAMVKHMDYTAAKNWCLGIIREYLSENLPALPAR